MSNNKQAIVIESLSISKDYAHRLEIIFRGLNTQYLVMLRTEDEPAGDGVILLETGSLGQAVRVRHEALMASDPYYTHPDKLATIEAVLERFPS